MSGTDLVITVFVTSKLLLEATEVYLYVQVETTYSENSCGSVALRALSLSQLTRSYSHIKL